MALNSEFESFPLLASKTSIPDLPRALVPRQRLRAALNRAKSKRCVVLSAPAGYGKTSAVLDWCYSASRAYSWVSLAQSDNEPHRFAAYIMASLHQQCPDLDSRFVEIAIAGRFYHPEIFFTQLLDYLQRNPVELTLVWDDFHLINHPEIIKGAEFFIQHLPSCVQLILLSRCAPGFDLSKQILDGQAVELSASELRFSEEESAAFFAKKLPFNVSSEQNKRAWQQVSGWPSGLQLLALAVDSANEFNEQVALVKGSTQVVAEYLAAHILVHQPNDVQAFLIATSVFDRFTCEMALLLTGFADAQRHLDFLVKQHLFVEVGQQGTWYRYHPIFTEFLRHQAQRKSKVEYVVRQTQASAIWLQRGNYLEAVQHALEAQDEQAIAQVLLSHGWALFDHNEASLLRQSFQRLSDSKMLKLAAALSHPRGDYWKLHTNNWRV